MDRISLDASERELLGKNVKRLRVNGKLPGHVYGKGVETEHVTVDTKVFLNTFKTAGETGLVDLKIGAEKIRPVLIRGVQYDPVTDKPLHIDFYQVDLKVKVKVPIPIELIGDEPEKVHLGEAIVLQILNEVEVMALPEDLIEKIEVNIENLKNIDDAITVGDLSYDREKLTIGAEPEEVVVKLAPAVTAEMEALLEEQAAETEAAAEEVAVEEGMENKEVVEGEEVAASEVPDEGGKESKAASAEGSGEPEKTENR